MVQGESVKKKVLIVVPNLQLGGQERVAVNTAEILKKSYEVVLVTFDNVDPVYDFSGELYNLKIPVRAHRFGKLINVLLRSYKLKKLRKKNKIDFCLSYGWSANLVNCLAKGYGKTLTSVRGYLNIGKGFVDRFIYRRSDVIIGCSKEICSEICTVEEKIGDKVKCLYNPFDLKYIEAKGQENVEDYNFGEYTIVSHGRLAEVKNYGRLIKAFYHVNKKYPYVKLLIIGEGPERKNLEKLVDELELTNSVDLIGLRKNPFAYISKSSLYVLSSNNEGFPNSLVEGMCFLPVISTDCKTGPKEILCKNQMEDITYWKETDYGILVEQGEDEIKNINALSDAMEYLIINKKITGCFQKKAQDRCKSFSNENYYKNLSMIFEGEL